MQDPYLNVDTAIERLYQEWKKYGKIIVATDWDDTLYDFHKKGFTYPKLVEILKECQDLGFHIVVFTGSEKEKYPSILEGCKELGLNIAKINENAFPMPIGNHGKIYFNLLLDDRGGLSSAYSILRKTLDKIYATANLP